MGNLFCCYKPGEKKSGGTNVKTLLRRTEKPSKKRKHIDDLVVDVFKREKRNDRLEKRREKNEEKKSNEVTACKSSSLNTRSTNTSADKKDIPRFGNNHFNALSEEDGGPVVETVTQFLNEVIIQCVKDHVNKPIREIQDQKLDETINNKLHLDDNDHRPEEINFSTEQVIDHDKDNESKTDVSDEHEVDIKHDYQRIQTGEQSCIQGMRLMDVTNESHTQFDCRTEELDKCGNGGICEGTGIQSSANKLTNEEDGNVSEDNRKEQSVGDSYLDHEDDSNQDTSIIDKSKCGNINIECGATTLTDSVNVNGDDDDNCVRQYTEADDSSAEMLNKQTEDIHDSADDSAEESSLEPLNDNKQDEGDERSQDSAMNRNEIIDDMNLSKGYFKNVNKEEHSNSTLRQTNGTFELAEENQVRIIPNQPKASPKKQISNILANSTREKKQSRKVLLHSRVIVKPLSRRDIDKTKSRFLLKAKSIALKSAKPTLKQGSQKRAGSNKCANVIENIIKNGKKPQVKAIERLKNDPLSYPVRIRQLSEEDRHGSIEDLKWSRHMRAEERRETVVLEKHKLMPDRCSSFKNDKPSRERSDRALRTPGCSSTATRVEIGARTSTEARKKLALRSMMKQLGKSNKEAESFRCEQDVKFSTRNNTISVGIGKQSDSLGLRRHASYINLCWENEETQF